MTVKITNQSDVALTGIKITDDLFKFNNTHATLAKNANVSKDKTITFDSELLDEGVLDTVIKIEANEFSKPLYVPFFKDLEEYVTTE